MDDRSTKYAVLRDLRAWDASVRWTKLDPRADGTLELTPLPATLDGDSIRLPKPYVAPASGIATRDDGTRYTSLTAAGGVAVSIDGCDVREERHGAAGRRFKQPTALLLVDRRLYVADTGNSRIVVVDAQSFDLIAEWTDGLQAPAGLASDSVGRIYVLDIDNRSVLRFAADGTSDAAFNAAMAGQANLGAPVALCVDGRDVLYVSHASGITRFDSNAAALTAIAPWSADFAPRVLVAAGDRLYAADSASGYVVAYDIGRDTWLGRLESYRGPVAACEIDAAGSLYVKPGLDEAVCRLDATAGRVQQGSLVAGPIDAGAHEVWERVWVDAQVPEGATLDLDVAAGGDTEPVEWTRSPSRDVLLRTLNLDAARRVWVRVRCTSSDGRASPRVLQVQAATAEDSYIEHLPSIYRRDDTNRFLENWLAAFRSELRDWEGEVEELSRRLDPLTVEEAGLPELAAWLALPLPPQDAPALRDLLSAAHALYRRRGTPSGLREMVRRYVGAEIHVVEAFRERRVWMLDSDSRLGFDTMLPAATPDGLIVAGSAFADRRVSGLRGDYYSGTSFESLRQTQVDDVLMFDWTTAPPVNGLEAGSLSVRWSGQVRPRFSEIYTFRARSAGGVRLQVNGRLLIDDWTQHTAADRTGQIRLEADRWYPMVIEYFNQSSSASVEFHWSSASERSQVIPKACLYPMFDDSVEFEPERGGVLEVGSAVVGQGRPQDSDSFGATLADDFAHRFTVVVAAARVPGAAQRQTLRDVIEAEKPAHTDYHLCLAEPRMRVGFQARLGIDAIVAGDPPPNRLGDTRLGHGSYLSPE